MCTSELTTNTNTADSRIGSQSEASGVMGGMQSRRPATGKHTAALRAPDFPGHGSTRAPAIADNTAQ